ncbi:MAG: ABC transporter ATP-binding protein [Clostridiales bacterium]|nr:ABC transporter ATP-binding protein [Clostridiales bacterium]
MNESLKAAEHSAKASRRAAEQAEPLVKAEHLTRYFRSTAGKVHAVEDVSFEIYPGETLALVGESGCGKSTLGRLLVRLLEPTEGTILMEGENLTRLKGKALRKKRSDLQIIFQDPFSSLDPHFTVGEIIAEPLRAAGYKKEEQEEAVLSLMERVGLPREYYYRYPHQFSGGQRQRIGIARALALNPKLIVCDEPVSALDVSIQAQILNLLRHLQRESHLTYLFISHDLAVVRYIADRICVMFLGQLCEICPTRDAYEHPLHPYTRMLIDSAPEPDPDFCREGRMLLKGELPSPVNPPSGCRFCTRCPFATDECRRVHPEMKDYGGGRFCACHHPLT